MKEIEELSRQMRDELSLAEQCIALYKRQVESQTQAKINEYEQVAKACTNELMSLKSRNEEKERELDQAQADISNLRKFVETRKEERKIRQKFATKLSFTDDTEPDSSELTEKINATKNMVRDLSKAVQMYEKRTGMQIKRIDEAKIQISFRCISRERPDLLHSFTVSVVGGKYISEATSHALAGFEGLVDELNLYGDFSKFVKSVRQMFKQLYP
eukprot:CAMPEP_0204901470 /NCGR_PEP_ID=MMETSP1397-20131031/3100_1 /ASSEMBLY_ACC=CAM_ASM_000891 /TAXON_ID=49980 /ORGANISM="Climacostomum Climacostomum virens, Strain Stock W-24" /LENGTH=214 /DNA_ID=CAMNT_0052069833 /DNA_START=122 /DNA_END=766 /DNA_ORIENTATION=+